jgi:hypothetical protein
MFLILEFDWGSSLQCAFRKSELDIFLGYLSERLREIRKFSIDE